MPLHVSSAARSGSGRSPRVGAFKPAPARVDHAGMPREPDRELHALNETLTQHAGTTFTIRLPIAGAQAAAA
jgi:hypothetical protein